MARKPPLEITLLRGDIASVTARAWVLGVFEDVAPSGPARAVDQHLGGAISELTSRRMFSGTAGSIFTLPAAQQPIPAETIVFAGLGAIDRFTGDVLEFVAENVVRTLMRARIDEFATVLWGGASGHDAGESAERMLRGFLRGILDARPGYRFRSLTLCEIEARRHTAVRRRLRSLDGSAFFSGFDVRLTAATSPRVRRRADPESRRDPIYLLVRQESDGPKAVRLRTSLLTAGDKATVVIREKLVKLEALDRQLEKLSVAILSMPGMQAFGENLGRLVLDTEVLDLLRAMRDRHLVVVHDVDASRIPWETLSVRIGRTSRWTPASAQGLSRRYAARNLSIAKWLDRRRMDAALRILLVVNPTEDLPAADAEGHRIERLAASSPGIVVRVLRGGEATKPSLRAAFESGEFDLMHYAGHAFFDAAAPERSGIISAEGEVLGGNELSELGSLPHLVFFNACEAGRIRARQRTEMGVGLAEAFLRAGVAQYVGTYWPVADDAASRFAARFYRELLRGAPIGEALVQGRRAVARLGSADWADYMHYGDPDFQLKLGVQ